MPQQADAASASLRPAAGSVARCSAACVAETACQCGGSSGGIAWFMALFRLL